MDLSPSPVLTAVAPYGRTNATVRARLLQWIQRLELDPVELVLATGPLGRSAQRRSRGSAQTPVLLIRNAAKLSRGRVEARLLRAGAPGVYDLDDGLPWDDGRLPGLGVWWKRPWPRSLIAERAAGSADRVIAGNELLAEWASTHCADVVVIPTCVEPADYVRKVDFDLSDPPRLGWLGSPATEQYLIDIAPALAELHRRTGARLTIVGGSRDLHPDLLPYSDCVDWTLAVQHSLPATWDVGIMPLRDGVYERAKCAYKLLQYGAVGLPGVGSPVGTNATVLNHSGSPAPRMLDDWVESVSSLLTVSAETREGQGAQASESVKLHYSFDRWEADWLSAVFGVRDLRRTAGRVARRTDSPTRTPPPR